MLTQHLPIAWWWSARCAGSWALVRRGRILDVGSGGGLPGVVLAVLEPGWAVTCVDGREVGAFIRQVAVELGLGIWRRSMRVSSH